MSQGSTAVLECRSVTVRYGHFTALNEASIAFERGQIHAVVGQNGAGKTSFARTCAGLTPISSGQILIEGRQLLPGRVRQARAAGIELVHQSFALPPSFSIAEAMEFGASGGPQCYSRRRLEAKWRDHLAALDVRVPLSTRIRELPIETQQSVEIARALVTKAKILILDEPTAVLSPAGTERLFERLRLLQKLGVTVLLILHKIREVLALAETITVLRSGRVVQQTVPAQTMTAEQLAAAIIGAAPRDGKMEDLSVMVGQIPVLQVEPSHRRGALLALMQLDHITTHSGQEDRAGLQEAQLTLHGGEIVGVAGIEGNGQEALLKVMAGLLPAAKGKITLCERNVTRMPLGNRRRLGLRIIPFERNREGLSLTSSLWENWAVGKILRQGLMQVIHPAKLRAENLSAMKNWDVRFAAVEQVAGSLSGGNAQKLIFSREIDQESRVILAGQPTRGLDIGATAFVWKSLREARDRGCAILLISSDLDELFEISDRLIVMYGGRILREFHPPYDLSKVGEAMTGASP